MVDGQSDSCFVSWRKKTKAVIMEWVLFALIEWISDNGTIISFWMSRRFALVCYMSTFRGWIKWLETELIPMLVIYTWKVLTFLYVFLQLVGFTTTCVFVVNIIVVVRGHVTPKLQICAQGRSSSSAAKKQLADFGFYGPAVCPSKRLGTLLGPGGGGVHQ